MCGCGEQFEIAVVRALVTRFFGDPGELDADEAYSSGWVLLTNYRDEMTAFQRERLLTAVAELERDRNAKEILREMHDSLVKHVAETAVPGKKGSSPPRVVR